MDSFKEDSDVFEITDFTTASDWERFIAALEEIFNEWKLASNGGTPCELKKGDIASGTWHQEKEGLSFADFKFCVTRHTLVPRDAKTVKEQFETTTETPGATHSAEEVDDTPLPVGFSDILNATNDFPGKAHCLVRWYGIRDFVVLSCATPGETVSSESRVKILLSSINIAINNTGCTLPVFLEIDRPQRQLYFGVCEGAGMKLNFEMACLKKIPSHLRYMSGLVDMFLKKLGACVVSPPKISVALRFTYVINNWPLHLTSCLPEDVDDSLDFRRLRAGPLEDPISDLIMATTWPRVDSIMVADSENYSDLDPLSAPQWHLRADFVDRPQCNLWDTMRQYMKICKRKETMNDMFPTRVEDNTAGGQPTFSRAIERLTESRVAMPTLSSAVRQARSHLKRRWMENAPLGEDLVEELMEFIFTDKDVPTAMGAEDEEEEQDSDGRTEQHREVCLAELDKILEKQLKCAPMVSLAHRLAVALACIAPGGGIHAVAQLWQEVLVELRTRWEAALFITNFGPDAAPDLGTSLFHQKLQMLNCCIAKKISGENVTQEEVTAASKNAMEEEEAETTEDGESEDEFFECRETLCDNSPRPTEYDGRPRGRKEECGNLRLLEHPDEPLFVPFTQEAAPMTEDAVEEHTKKMSNLGTSPEAASIRARMQSASLISDMESFKAANPSCCLEDFVRWYSPRDFIVEATGAAGNGGKLSPRMEVPGNLWVEAWREAKFVPARRQKRLFDETAEAEKVFRYFEDLRPGDLCQELLPNILAEALRELTRYYDPELGPLEMPSVLETVRERAGLATRLQDAGLERYDDVLRRLAHAEVLIARAKSLEAKFLGPKSQPNRQALLAFVRQCLSDLPEVALVGASRGPVGEALQRLMTECQREETPTEDTTTAAESESTLLKFPDPSGKEYILRTEVPMPAQASRLAPQRLYCAVQRDDYRLCGAFARDTMFY